jgi:hypothetical protein
MFIPLRSFLTLIVYLSFAFHNKMEALEPDFSKKSPKYNLSICSLFKNEAKYLKEWIEYHRLIGVDHFYLYNNGSWDGFRAILNPYIKEGVVTLINWPDLIKPVKEEKLYEWVLTTQISAYENAIKVQAMDESKWLVIVDVDEFLVPPDAGKLIDLLEKYDGYSGVKLAYDFFDAAQADIVPKRRLLIETVDLISPPSQNIVKAVAKIVFKPEMTAGFLWPPYQTLFKDDQPLVTLRKREIRINRYTNRDLAYSDFRKVREKLDIDNRVFSEEEMTLLLAEGYRIIDQERAIYRFIPQLRKKMGYVTGWELIDDPSEIFAIGD